MDIRDGGAVRMLYIRHAAALVRGPCGWTGKIAGTRTVFDRRKSGHGRLRKSPPIRFDRRVPSPLP